MRLLRKLLFGNWRNKGVALFFALTIWYVAYQSEKKEWRTKVRVDLVSTDPSYRIKEAFAQPDGRGEGASFDGVLHVSFSGPRKQIELLRDELPPLLVVPVGPEEKAFSFERERFALPVEGVEIVRVDPPSLSVSQEEVEEVTVKNIAEKINVDFMSEKYEVGQKMASPATPELRIVGPKSFVGDVGVALNVDMSGWREYFEGKVPVELIPPEGVSPEVLRRTVDVHPSDVEVLVSLRPRTVDWAADAVRVRFLLPPARFPVKVIVDDIVGDTIPVEFFGPKAEIDRLKAVLRDEPGFSLGVRVPPLDREQGVATTFTEDLLVLDNRFPSVKIRQHPKRAEENKGAWSYTVVPVEAPGT